MTLTLQTAPADLAPTGPDGKAADLDVMMQQVKACDLCCNEAHGISKDKLLVNLIAERPDGPRYGEIPSMYTDWAPRLGAKIAVILQDWGSTNGALNLRHHYERLVQEGGLSREDAWRETVQHRPEYLTSLTHRKLIQFLKISAELEGLQLPTDFLDHIYFTNAVLCFRQGSDCHGDKAIDLKRSIGNCCTKKAFLRRQLEIVKPTVVVALGDCALKALGVGRGVGSMIKLVNQPPSDGYRRIFYKGLPVSVVPAYHPAQTRKPDEEHIRHYRNIWRALSGILELSGVDLVKACFSYR